MILVVRKPGIAVHEEWSGVIPEALAGDNVVPLLRDSADLDSVLRWHH
jgi:hypothetical protein